MNGADAEVTAYIGRWRPSSVSAEAAVFARDVIRQAAPDGQERAKNLLWAAGKLADYAIRLGLELVPEVVLHPSVAERFARCAPGLSGVARRTLRTNLRFTGRRADPLGSARRARHRHRVPVRRGRGHRPRRPAARRAGTGPLPRPAAGRRPVRTERPDLRRR
jgi:hypothetical protein